MTEPYLPLGLMRYRTRRRRLSRWTIARITAELLLLPVAAMAAYDPAALLSFNNLSDVANTATALSNLGGVPTSRTISTTAPVTGGGDLSANRTIAVSNATATASGLVPTPPNNTTTFFRGDATFATPPSATATTAGYVPTPPNNTTTFLRGDATFASPTGFAPTWTVTRYTSNTASVTLAHTNYLVEAIAQGTPAALTVNLNATSPAAGDIQCVKDEANTFATNNATVKTTDSSTIDGVAGSTGYVMNQTKQFTCFMYDGSNTNWMIQ
jgi:hypothetical protein